MNDGIVADVNASSFGQGAAGLAWLEAGSAMLAELLFSAALWGVTHES